MIRLLVHLISDNQHRKLIPTDSKAFYLLVGLMDFEFFSSLNYSLPKNSTESFNINEPLYIFNRSLEKSLLELFYTAYADNPDKYEETIYYVKKVLKEKLPKRSIKLLLANLEKMITKNE